jgi:hypothetical protein
MHMVVLFEVVMENHVFKVSLAYLGLSVRSTPSHNKYNRQRRDAMPSGHFKQNSSSLASARSCHRYLRFFRRFFGGASNGCRFLLEGENDGTVFVRASLHTDRQTETEREKGLLCVRKCV